MLAAENDGTVIEAVFGLSTDPAGTPLGRIDDSATERLGIEAITTLAIRPDRYIGLRRDGTDGAAVANYVASLTT